ncbi:hypothetical protein [Nostoc sp.]|uniref:hypothetical protein n=1 Tax=Nostoc sp. TaxID=1180 RepID=UPI002FF8A951
MSIDLVVNALKSIAKPAASLVINQAILNLFREREIKNAFWSAYTANNPLGFCKEVEKFLKGNDLEYDIRLLRIELRSQLEEFGEIFIQVAQRSKSKEFEPFTEWNLDEYPAEFKSLIREKIRSFCGRKFVFKAFKQFCDKNRSGYFTVIGDAGMGKSTIAAKYVWDNKSPCYFNIRSDGRNRAKLFLDSIRKQLIKRYQLQNAEKANLADLLEQVSKKLPTSDRLV